MGSSKKVTVSYWYKLIAHLGWCKGPIDALLEIRGGDRTAWFGRQDTNGIINVNKPNLYGGESAEGGIDGQFEVMLGGASQAPNSYLAGVFGPAQPAYRGRSTVVLRGPKVGAGNPYPKPLYFKLERLYKGWDNDVCWYPEKVAIPIPDDGSAGRVVIEDTALSAANVSGDPSVPVEYREVTGLSPLDVLEVTIPEDGTYKAWSPWSADDSVLPTPPPVPGLTWYNGFRVTTDHGHSTYLSTAFYKTADVAFDAVQSLLPIRLTGSTSYRFWLYDPYPPDDRGGLSLRVTVKRGMFAMNPAHILYDSITSRRENGGMEEPVEMIDEDSFIAAADKLYEEGFGLCCTWSGGESAEQFQQRILNVIGGSLTQSRRDGKYRLHLLRGDYNVNLLPVLTDNDIAEFEAEPAVPTEAINQIQVKWFNPGTREERITTPIQSLGAIEESGGVFPDVREYYEIPYEALALRVAQRDLNSVTCPLWKFTLSCTRKMYDLTPGTYVRLMLPNRGFADMVAVVGDVDFGDLGNPEMSLVLLQDVFGLPDSAYVEPQPPLNPPEDNGVAANITRFLSMEAPYVELAAAMPSAELNAIAPDAGYVLAGAARPNNGNNFLIATKTGADDYVTYGTGDYCGFAVVTEGDDLLNGVKEDFTFSGESNLDRVDVGTWAMWGREMVVVKALDPEARTVSFGRGVGDSVPTRHGMAEFVYFLGDWNVSDGVEYVEGEDVWVKLLNRTSQDVTDIDAAVADVVPMSRRQDRPYPPGNLRVNGQSYPATVSGDLVFTWAHRDRLLQSDQLIDTTQSSIGPEAGVVYNLRIYDKDENLIHTETAITGDTFAYTNAQEIIDIGGGGSGPVDPSWAQVVSLLHFNGADGATSTTDEKALTWSFFGNAQLDTANKRFGSAALLLDGSSDYISATHSSLVLGGGDYTVEGWAYYDADSYTAYRCIFSTFLQQSNGRIFVVMEPNGNFHFGEQGASGAPNLGGASSTKVPIRQWFHFAATRSGTTLRLFLNGTKIAEFTGQAVRNDYPGHLRIGALDAASGSYAFWWVGAVDEVRVTKGVSRYTADFSAPTAPFPDGSGTEGLSPSLRVELEAERDGIISYTKHDIILARVGYGAGYGESYGGEP